MQNNIYKTFRDVLAKYIEKNN